MGAPATFGQELYLEESAAALRLALTLSDRRELRDAIARRLTGRSAATRRRIADKLIQRLVPTQGRHVVVDAYLRLAGGTQDAQTRRDLIFFRTAAVDRLIGAIAAEILYPWLVARQRPRGLSASEFEAANSGMLFDQEPAVAFDAVRAYARKVWGFRSGATLARAMRILRRAGIIHATGEGARFAASARAMSPEAFAFCIYEEMLARGNRAPAMDQLQGARCARVFLLSPVQVAGLIEDLRTRGLLRAARGPGRRFALVYEDLDDLVGEGLGIAPR